MRLILKSLATGILIMLAVSTAWAAGMRCGNDIVSPRDSAYIVLQRCGDPIAKTHVGYTLDEENKREFVIEEWVYGPNNGYFYFVTMTGGRVSDIRSERR